MKAKRQFTRRRFIQLSASAVAAGATVSCGRLASPWRSLTDQETRTLSSLCGQIVPEDQDPGATSAGVVNYIDVQLSSRLKAMKNAVAWFGTMVNKAEHERNWREIDQYSEMVRATSRLVQIAPPISPRPEATASVVRAYIEHGMQVQPGNVKLYYMGPMFRRERPQKGRYRQYIGPM